MLNKFLNWFSNSWLGYGYCYRCRTTWNRCKEHTVWYSKNKGMFPLCEKCWSELTPEQRLPYYYNLANKNIQDNHMTQEEFKTMEQNVLNGL